MNRSFLLTANNPVLSNHKAYGQELLPGLAYVDLLYQFFRENGYDYRRLELRELSIYHPLIVGASDEGVRVDLRCTEIQGKEAWRVELEGRRSTDTAGNQRYVVAEMHCREPLSLGEEIAVAARARDHGREILLDDLYARCRSQQLVHTGLMKAEGIVHLSEDGALIDVCIPEEERARAKQFMFHPTLIDGSAVGCGAMYPSSLLENDQRLFLPLFLESFRAFELLQEACTTRVKAASFRLTADLLSYDMEFFNRAGQKVGELKRFVNKLVREAGLINPGLAKSPSAPRRIAAASSKDAAASVRRETEASSSKAGGGLRAEAPISARRPEHCDSARAGAEQLIKEVLAVKLAKSVDAIDPDEGYFEMGLQSAMLLEVVAELAAKLGISLAPTLLFEHATVNQLAEYLATTYGAAIDTSVDPRAAQAAVAQEMEAQAAPRSESVGAAMEPPRTGVPEEEIAVIGISGKYPGARSISEFWENLKAGKDCVTEIPKDRWDWRIMEDMKTPSGKKMSRWGGFIDDVDRFDAQFFRISPREARVLDPQERLFLEVCWEAIEDAGYTPATLTPLQGRNKRREVGVFVGVMHKDYTLIGADAVSRGARETPLTLNCAPIANRVSFVCDFHGPSMAIDTVCSASLTAVHMAVQSLLLGESSVALAGGVNLSLHPNKYMTYGMQDMHSSDGRCRAFGDGGDGYVSGDGIGAVLLKPRSKAERDGDQIYAIIKKSVINHGGKASGITVPSPVAQNDMIQRCFEATGIDARSISCIEAHGTGTSLGDPIEIQGLVSAFRQYTSERQFCSLGSVKSNIGHAESAAGISGLTKVILQLRHETLVPSLYSATLNPQIDLASSPFYIQHQTEHWKRPVVIEDGKEKVYPRRAGVSSFGATGSNAHVIVEEYVAPLPHAREASPAAQQVIVPLSARSSERLNAYAQRLLEFLEKDVAASRDGGSVTSLEQIAYTLQVGRLALAERLAIVVDSKQQLIERLRSFVVGGAAEDLFQAKAASDKRSAQAADDAAAMHDWIDARDLPSLAQAWVRGAEPDWRRLYTGVMPRRVSLPTYPFERDSYWIDLPAQAIGRSATAAVAADTTVTALLVAADPEPSHEVHAKPSSIRLGDPATLSIDFPRSTLAKPSSICLAPLLADEGSLPERGTQPGEERPVQVFDDANGVYRIAIAGGPENRLTGSILSGLEESFRTLRRLPDARVVLLTGSDNWFLSEGAAEEHSFHSSKALLLPLMCEIPVVAVMKGSCTGLGWLLACACDFMIVCEESAYGQLPPSRPGSRNEARFLEARFGTQFARGALLSGERRSGDELRDLGCGVAVLPKRDIDAYAARFARRLSAAPRASLELLKKHFNRGLTPRVEAIVAGSVPRETAERPASIERSGLAFARHVRGIMAAGANVPSSAAPISLAVDSHVVTVDLYRDGVVLVTLCDRESKNSFSAALIEGISKAFQAIGADPRCKVVVLTGHGNYFACGATAAGLVAIQEGRARYSDAPLYELPLFCELPVIAAMQGHGIGAGWSLGLFCDYEIYSEESVYSTRFMELGITPGFGSTMIFPEKLGFDLGREVLFTAAEYKGTELRSRGVDITVLPRAEVLSSAVEVASRLAAAPRTELIELKARTSEQRRTRLKEVVDLELAMQQKTFVGNKETLERIRSEFPEESDGRVAASQSDDAAVMEQTDDEPVATDAVILESIRAMLRRSFGEELLLKPHMIDDEASFVDMGLDSITGVTWIQKVNDEYGLSLPATIVYSHSTMKDLARGVLEEGKKLRVFGSAPKAVANPQPARPAPSESKLHTAHSAKSASKVDAAPPLESQRKVTLPNVSASVHSAALAAKTEPSSATLAASRVPSNLSIAEGLIAPAPLSNVRPSDSPMTAGKEGPTRARRHIAVVGMAGQFPKARNLEEFWDNLASGRDCVSEIPADRWDLGTYYDADREAKGKTYCKWMGVLEDAALFDPKFFGLSPREAEEMDPQQRLFLQAAWQCIEDAGCHPASLSGSRCGVFVGCSASDYASLKGVDGLSALGLMGGSPAILAGRISYLLNLQGPCLSIDTACSASLVAIASACDSLVLGHSDAALAGGVCVMSGPTMHVMASKAGMLSQDGRCFAFDHRANGFVPGEGVGVLLLKRLADAERDGDHIYGVISGWGVNQDGKTNGITAPNPDSQARLQQDVYDRYAIDPQGIQLLEAHGTGTALGDPIEVQGLRKAFEAYTAKRNFCALGSVKSNIGHTLSAAGVASAIKVLLSLEHRKLPPTIHFERLNEHIDLADSAFYVNADCRDWVVPVGETRRSAVSSFGFSGTNAHVVFEEYAADRQQSRPSSGTGRSRTAGIVVLSAKNRERLRDYAAALVRWIGARKATDKEFDLLDLAYTLQTGRQAMDERLGLVASSLSELEEKLRRFVDGDEHVDGLRLGHAKHHKEAWEIFAADEDLQRAIDQWLELGRLPNVLDLWVRGLDVHWRRLYRNHVPRKLSLPVYPFARERYWVTSASTPPLAADSPHGRARPVANLSDRVAVQSEDGQRLVREVVVSAATSALLRFEELWQERNLPPAQLAQGSEQEHVLLCFLNAADRQRRFAEKIAALSPRAKVIFVSDRPGEAGREHPHYYVSSQSAAAYEALLRRVGRDHGELSGIVYGWAIEEPRYVTDPSPIVFLLQGLSASGLAVRNVLLAGACRDSLEQSYLESWIGFERSAGMVLPETRVAVVLDGPTALESAAVGLTPMELWAERLCNELRANQAHRGSVLYRSGKRYVCEARPIDVEDRQQVFEPSLVKCGGTYLLTGGCGGLGLLFARYLLENGAKNLILTGRSQLSAAKAEKIKSLERMGGKIFYLQSDVCDAESMQQGLAAAQREMGAVNGVIHAAGVQEVRSVLDNDIQSFKDVLAPKIEGTVLLEELLAHQPLDFVCYCSSISAVLGDFGSCSYAVGNRFQMAYARHRHELVARGERRGKTLAIAWPLWREGGMEIGEAEQTRLYLSSSGQRFLEAAEGFELFADALRRPHTHELVIAGEPSRVRRFLGMGAAESQAPRPIAALRPRFATTYADSHVAALEEHLDRDLKDQISRLTKLAREELDGDRNLSDFGFDSISLAELARALSDRFGCTFAPSLFFSYPTIDKLRGYFLKEQPDVVRAFYERSRAKPVAPVEVKAAVPATPRSPHVHSSRPEVPPRQAGTAPEPIAIIGMSGRFPQARSIEEMWNILFTARNAVQEIPGERFDWREYYGDPAVDRTKTNCKWTGVVPGVREFDPLFFEISPSEAELMDPRQRLLLQEAWKALEDAGFGEAQLEQQRIGMFVGVEEGDYGFVAPVGSVTATHNGILAARLAYFVNLRGPVMAINTACSSGLVAAHQAILSLRSGECDAAIVAGVNLMLSPELYVGMSQAGMLSSDGECRAFDKGANGMVPGEAVTVVVLKRLSAAEADRDPIHAIIAATGVNYDGKTNGITAPSGLAQTELLKSVYSQSAINPDEIEYVVTHGTGTKLGDPVEINALYDAFKSYTTRPGYCALTSTKGNLGHTFAASGLVSMISLVEALKHECIPASLHCAEENDYIQWDQSPFFVNKANKPWPSRPARARLGAVSAFGMSGTNAHAVVQEYTELPRQAGSSRARLPRYVLALSGKTKEALLQKIRDMLEYLETHQDSELLDISYTLLTGRHAFRHRCVIVVEDRYEAAAAWQAILGGGTDSNHALKEVSRDSSGRKRLQGVARRLANLSASSRNDDREHRDNLNALAELYCQGCEIPWDELFAGTYPRKIHLPTYPFARAHYWPAGAGKVRAVVDQDSLRDVAVERSPGGASGGSDDSREDSEVRAFLTRVIGTHLKVPREALEFDKPLDEYGLDSIKALEMVREIQLRIEDIPQTLFLENSTLNEVEAYITAHHALALARSDVHGVESIDVHPTGAGERSSESPTPSPAPGSARGGSVSITGMAGIFPGATDIEQFWQNMVTRKVVTSPLPKERAELLKIDHEHHAETHGGYLSNIQYFDYEEFKISRAEATLMDPQLRKLLEATGKAIADAGYTLSQFRNAKTGVFVATKGHSGYREIVTQAGAALPGEYFAEGTGLYANRISNVLNLKGPSEVIDVGCASFLVAIRNAVAAIRDGRCKQAIVGAAELCLSASDLKKQGSLYTATSSTRSFSHDSDGYVYGEAIGALVLKAQEDARRDGDCVYANIKGVGVCHGGKAPLKWYSPNVVGQKMAIEEALADAGIDPATVTYIEAEANGSQLGDASEIVAIQAVYGPHLQSARATSRCNNAPVIRVGSLKPLLGHAESASTFPSVVKMVNCLRAKRLPGVHGLGDLNQSIKLQEGFEIPKDDAPWSAISKDDSSGSILRRGAVHSLSLGGVNAHLILEEAEDPPEEQGREENRDARREGFVFVFSARSDLRLRSTIAQYVTFLGKDDMRWEEPATLARLEHTLRIGREGAACRLAVIARSRDELRDLLKRWLDGAASAGIVLGSGASAASVPTQLSQQSASAPTGSYDSDLARVAKRWVAGETVEWNAPQGAGTMRKMNTPPVALMPLRCWPDAHEDGPKERNGQGDFGTLMLRPEWSEKPLPPRATPVSERLRVVVFCDWPASKGEELSSRLEGSAQKFVLSHGQGSVADRYSTYALRLFEIVKEVLRSRPRQQVFLQLVLPNGLERVCLQGLAGLLKTAQQENSRFVGQTIVLNHQTSVDECALRLVENLGGRDDAFVQYVKGRRWVQKWSQMVDQVGARSSFNPLWKENAVILITGGAGGLGLIVAEEIARRSKGARLVLTGRSPYTAEKQHEIERLRSRTVDVTYIQSDVSNRDDVAELMKTVRARYGSLTAIVHSAGIIRDSYIVKKSLEDVGAVLAPKVAGAFNLDEATRDMNLDVMILFSSVAGVLGNVGQADYAMANAYMDAYAIYRNQLAALGMRHGRTLSINWPLWKSGGMRVNSAVEQIVERTTHMVPMPTESGIAALESIVEHSEPRTMTLYGKKDSMKDSFVSEAQA